MSSALAAASLILKPEGYSEGRLQTLKPIEELGSEELVTNGGFDTNSDWTFIGSANIANGVVNFVTSGDFVIQSNVVSLSVKTYKIQYEVISSNNAQLRFAGGNSAFPVTTLPSSVGVHAITAVSNGTQGSLQFNSNGFIGSIDNVSVKEVLVDGGDFTFTRGSNLSATRVNSAGLIEKGRENLFKYSNQFDTTWLKTGVSVTSGQSGYDGSSDAWLLTKTTIFSNIKQSLNQSNVCTFSVYAKANTYSWLLLHIEDSAGDAVVSFNLNDGSIGSQVQNVYASTESVGNGWYRCSITALKNATEFRIYPNESNGYSGAAGSIYIQDAQLEAGMVATDYIETAASTVKAGILENTPRLDYSGGATEPSLLLEPSRTNVIGQSEYFDEWTKISEPTITNNYGTSPEGVQNSTRFETTSGRLTYDVTTINADETFSIYMRGSGTLRMQIGSDNFYPSVTSDWVRYEFKTTQVGSNGNVQIRGNGSAVDVQLYGAQYERNSYPTSYIPTYGSSVTRSAESFEKTGLSSVIGQTEGTIFFEFEYSHQQINTPFFRVLENSSNLYEIIALSSFKLRSRARIGNSIVAAIDTASVVTEGTHKAAIIYKSGDYKFYLDGSLVGSSTENSIVSNPSEINYFNNNNNLKQFLTFPTALSDADCITLTTL